MTIRLTLKCSQGCKHCLVDALPNSPSIDKDTLDNCLQLIKHINPIYLNLSGGEITEMDNWVDVINEIIQFIKDNKLRTKLYILSNGTFVFNQYEQMKDLVQDDIVHRLFISTNPTFYKDSELILKKLINFPKLQLNLHDRKETLKNLGRAKNLNVNLNTPASCALLFNIIKNSKATNLKELFNQMPLGYCSPMINVDGNIYLGWSNECRCVGNVNTDSYDNIYNNIKSFIPCGKCKQLIS